MNNFFCGGGSADKVGKKFHVTRFFFLFFFSHLLNVLLFVSINKLSPPLFLLRWLNDVKETFLCNGLIKNEKLRKSLPKNLEKEMIDLL